MKRTITSLALLLCTSWAGNAAWAQTTGEIAKGNVKSCATVCEKTINYCNDKGGKLGQATLSNAIKDCITECKSAGELLGRSSGLSSKEAAVCVDACNECAKACDQFKGDSQLTECANECRKTASNLQKVK